MGGEGGRRQGTHGSLYFSNSLLMLAASFAKAASLPPLAAGRFTYRRVAIVETCVRGSNQHDGSLNGCCGAWICRQTPGHLHASIKPQHLKPQREMRGRLRRVQEANPSRQIVEGCRFAGRRAGRAPCGGRLFLIIHLRDGN